MSLGLPQKEKDFNRIHFIGIGGIGMSGMAELLNELGFIITGSDLENSEVVLVGIMRY